MTGNSSSARKLTSESVSTVRKAVALVDVMSEFVTLKPNTRLGLASDDNMVGRCPFHDVSIGSVLFGQPFEYGVDHDTALTVSRSKNVYFCCVCTVGGDSIKFLMDLLGMTFNEAVERLARRVGVEVRYVGVAS